MQQMPNTQHNATQHSTQHQCSNSQHSTQHQCSNSRHSTQHQSSNAQHSTQHDSNLLTVFVCRSPTQSGQARLVSMLGTMGPCLFFFFLGFFFLFAWLTFNKICEATAATSHHSSCSVYLADWLSTHDAFAYIHACIQTHIYMSS
jgi:hypothetical protein